MPAGNVALGETIAWADVPDGSLVKWRWIGRGWEYFYRRHAHVVSRVGTYTGIWLAPGRDDGTFDPCEMVTVVALNLSGRESADDLRRLSDGS